MGRGGEGGAPCPTPARPGRTGGGGGGATGEADRGKSYSEMPPDDAARNFLAGQGFTLMKRLEEYENVDPSSSRSTDLRRVEPKPAAAPAENKEFLRTRPPPY